MRLNGKSVCFKKQKHSVLLINSFFIYISFLGHMIKKPSLLHTQLGVSLKYILKTEPEYTDR